MSSKSKKDEAKLIAAYKQDIAILKAMMAFYIFDF